MTPLSTTASLRRGVEASAEFVAEGRPAVPVLNFEVAALDKHSVGEAPDRLARMKGLVKTAAVDIDIVVVVVVAVAVDVVVSVVESVVVVDIVVVVAAVVVVVDIVVIVAIVVVVGMVDIVGIALVIVDVGTIGSVVAPVVTVVVGKMVVLVVGIVLDIVLVGCMRAAAAGIAVLDMVPVGTVGTVVLGIDTPGTVGIVGTVVGSREKHRKIAAAADLVVVATHRMEEGRMKEGERSQMAQKDWHRGCWDLGSSLERRQKKF